MELGARNQREIFVELKPSLRGHKKDISATLGHECAHIFLRRHGLELPDRWANEILTDTTAALYGFGALMADTYRVSSTRQATATGTMVTWHEQSMGYLTPDELGYVLTRTGFADVDRYLESSAARDALECGRARALRELAAPPFAHAGLWARVVYGARRLGAQLVMGGPGAPDDDRPYALHDGRITFRCPVCCKLLRLPVGRRLTAACPTCKHSVRCVT